MWSQRDHKILIGAEGITASPLRMRGGSYTWGKGRFASDLPVDCALEKLTPFQNVFDLCKK